MNDQALAILMQEVGKGLMAAAAKIMETAPISDAPATTSVPASTPAVAEVVQLPTQTTPAPQQVQSPWEQATAPQASLPATAPTAAAPMPTLDDVVHSFRQLQQTKGPEAIAGRGGILEQFGIARVSEASPDLFPALISSAQARMSAPGVA